jgi:HSP20 family protein
MRTNGNQDQGRAQPKPQSTQATTGQNVPAQRGITQQQQGQRGLSRGQGYAREWGPFGLLSRMFEDIDRAFGLDFDRGIGLGRGEGQRSMFRPQVEVFERDNKLIVRADLPGLQEQDVKVEVDEGVLTISGERRNDFEEKREGYFHSERSYGYFQRSVRLPEGIDLNQIQARFDSGVLEVEAPIPEQKPKGRNVPITGAQQQPQQQQPTAGATQAGGQPSGQAGQTGQPYQPQTQRKPD